MVRPRKLKIPFKLNDWLRLALHGKKKRPEDRWKIFREWRRWCLKDTLKRDPTDDELESEIRQWQGYEFYHTNREWGWSDNLTLDFLPIYTKEQKTKRAKAMAAGTWSEENRKKRAKTNRKKS